METATWITQLFIICVLAIVIAGVGAPPQDGREPPTVREEFEDLVYWLRGCAAKLKRRWQQRGTRKKPPHAH